MSRQSTKQTSHQEIWRAAADVDDGLRLNKTLLAKLEHLRVFTQPSSRETLFDSISSGDPAVLRGVKVPIKGDASVSIEKRLVQSLVKTFRKSKARESLVHAQVGRSRRRRYLSVAELVRRWASSRHIVSVTDLHIRGTMLERMIDTSALSQFNLFLLGSDTLQVQEMMTMVISSAGNVTDSHSDDPDGSNHCFVGRKLWLAWDTFEGREVGLEDCSRDLVKERAHFDLSKFAKLSSARWWTVESGETLFLPGRMTHRVITLEPYIGIGSFYCTPVSALENLSRWCTHGALWSLDDAEQENENLVSEIAELALKQINKLKKRSLKSQQQWGLDFVPTAVREWKNRTPKIEQHQMAAHPKLSRVLDAFTTVA
jgi:hypothetical protein